MKKTSSFIPTLLIFLTLVFLPNVFAQGTLFQPRVSLIYFLPKDRPVRPDRITAIQALIQDTQTFFADEMERHGYGRKTFTLETDRKGEPVVHQMRGKFNDAYYRRKSEALEDVWAEVKEQFDSPQRIYFIAIDINSEMFVPWGGAAKGYHEQRGKGTLMAASGGGFNLPLAAHELGHAFALEHDFRDPAYILSYGGNRRQLSECAAVWLDAHSFFNNPSSQVNRDASIQMLSPTAAPNGIRLRFEVADADGLHQAMLYLKPTSADPARDFKLDGCRLLDADSDTIEFVTSELVDPFQDEVTLQVIDKHGGMKRETFPIKFVHLLPPPKNVSIPDRNLAAAVRKTLGLAPNTRITDQAMKKLTTLDARNSQIKNLTGLEHATQLRLLELRQNQIRDIRPLAKLKSLKKLILEQNAVRDISHVANMAQLTWLLIGGNPISDFTPLANLNQLEGLGLWGGNISDVKLLANKTKLTHLWVGGHNISNIAPLTNLTQLKVLELRDNRIRNVNPLVGLKKLEELSVRGNPIQDMSPLRTLLNRNPKLKLDIEIPPLSPVVHLEAAQRPPIYWVGAITGTLHRLVSDEVENLVPNVKNATSLAVDMAGGKLYWAEKISERTGRIRGANLDGTNVKLVKNLTSVPHGIVLDTVNGKLYLTNAWGKVQRLNVDGSNFQPNFITDLNTPRNLALDVTGGKVYWTETSGGSGRIRRANLDGSKVETIVTSLAIPMDIAVFGNTLYWAERMDEHRGEIRSIALTGMPNITTHRSFPKSVPLGIAVDGVEGTLYWTTSLGDISRSPLDGRQFPQQTVVTGLGTPERLAVQVKAPEIPEVLVTDAMLRIAPSPVISPGIGEQLTLSLNITAGEAVAGYQLS